MNIKSGGNAAGRLWIQVNFRIRRAGGLNEDEKKIELSAGTQIMLHGGYDRFGGNVFDCLRRLFGSGE